MDINAKRDGTTVIARPAGRLDSFTAGEFQEAVEAAMEDTDRALILDFQDVPYISSAGLLVILVTARTLQGNGGALALCSLATPVREVFAISGFDAIIPIHTSCNDALAAVAG